MGSNISHHFVPKCYLKNFSDAPHGKTVTLFNIARKKTYVGAPIKSQCARNKLYGDDDLEHTLAELEGKYAEWVTRGVLRNPPNIVNGIDDFCRFFLIIQYMRTQAHIARMRAHFALTSELANMPTGDDSPYSALDMSDTGLARDGIFFALESQKSINDLKLMFVQNCSNRNFITCDDPVIHTNRLYFQRVGDSNFGTSSAGAIFFLPLSPRVALILYDADVYAAKLKSKFWCDVKKQSDVEAFNDWVYLKANENVYANKLADLSLDRADQLSTSRIASWQRGRILVQTGENDDARFFRQAEEAPEDGGYVIMTSQQHLRPPVWPSILPFRSTPVAYSNGSGAGLVRKGQAPFSSTKFEKISL